MAPTHLEGILSCRPGVLRQGLLFLLAIRLKQEVVPRVDDCSQQGQGRVCVCEGWTPWQSRFLPSQTRKILEFLY